MQNYDEHSDDMRGEIGLVIVTTPMNGLIPLQKSNAHTSLLVRKTEDVVYVTIGCVRCCVW